MTHGSLFSGIGGFDLAAQWMGWENVFHCEWNEFGQRVLQYYWPEAISYEDITTTDFNIHRGRIDVLTGGFPCQPYSSAGKRLGKEDDRHLWPEMLRAIREIKPRYVVGENVYGIVNWNGGLVFNEVQVDLENEGYKVQPCILPACAVNAPHRRDRVWFVAYSKDIRCETTNSFNQWEKYKSINREGIWCSFGSASKVKPVTNTSDTRSKGLRSEREDSVYGSKIITNPKRFGQSKQGESIGPMHPKENTEWKASWSYDDGRWPTQSPVCGGNDGISRRLDGITFSGWRKESIKAYGNAIVPQVAYQIFKAIEIIENQ